MRLGNLYGLPRRISHKKCLAMSCCEVCWSSILKPGDERTGFVVLLAVEFFESVS